MKAIGPDNFESEVLNSDEPVLVDFWAPWCGPCRALKPVLEDVSVTGANVVTVNIADHPELAGDYNVTAIPTLIVFKNGKPTNRVVGLKNKEAILALISA